jgi:hypothetical protein
MKKILAIIIICLLPGIIQDCKKDKGEPPVLPPAESMSIDFTNFETSGKSDISISYPKGTQTSTWEFAAGVAIFWKLIINTTLAVPVAAFKVAVNQKPVYIEDKTWEWSYNATVLGSTYKARLRGQITSSNVLWKMYITKEGSGGYTDFLWFQGTSATNGTSGQWILNKSADEQVPILRIDWTKEGTSIGTVKYTYIETGSLYLDSYIEYGLTSNTLNAYYTIHYYSATYLEFLDLNVEWSTTLHNGRVSCPAFFGNSDWYCWDGNYLNIDCP